MKFDSAVSKVQRSKISKMTKAILTICSMLAVLNILFYEMLVTGNIIKKQSSTFEILISTIAFIGITYFYVERIIFVIVHHRDRKKKHDTMLVNVAYFAQPKSTRRDLRLAARSYQNYDPKHSCDWKTSCPYNKLPPVNVFQPQPSEYHPENQETALDTHNQRKSELQSLLTDTSQSIDQLRRDWKQHRRDYHKRKTCKDVARCPYLVKDPRFKFEEEINEENDCQFKPIIPNAPPPYPGRTGYECKEKEQFV